MRRLRTKISGKMKLKVESNLRIIRRVLMLENGRKVVTIPRMSGMMLLIN
jgi:hypothetical protein